MITIRLAADRGHANQGWLDSWHTFSFGDYHDTKHMGFRALRVINEDTVSPGKGFGEHTHSNMEIISYVLEGELAHKDSLGTGSVIRPGEVQRMTAGTGVRHSETNPSKTHPVHFLQIWLMPDVEDVKPDYEQRPFALADKNGRLELVASQQGHRGSITINVDAQVYATALTKDEHISHPLAPGRHAWVQVVRGSVKVNGQALQTGDGAALGDEASVELDAVGPAELLLFDLA